jgi:hypothetical protein
MTTTDAAPPRRKPTDPAAWVLGPDDTSVAPLGAGAAAA